MNLEIKFLGKDKRPLLFINEIQVGIVEEFVNRVNDYGLIIETTHVPKIFNKDLDFFYNHDQNQISQISLYVNFDNHPYLNWFEKDSRLTFIEDDTCSLYGFIDYRNWNKPYSIIEFLKELQRKINEEKDIGFEFDENEDFFEFGLSYEFSIKDKSRIIGDLYENLLNRFNDINKEVFTDLNNNLDENSLFVNFAFPEEIQSSCEQYLVYFSKFLEDIGINVSTEIKSEAKSTLFTVIPKNTDDALHKIREALNIYLNLPNTNDVHIVSKDYNDVSVQQLIANIYHLKSQLMLANSAIQLKDSTIEILKISNYQINSVKEKKENEEKILGGVVSVDEFEWKGFKLNLAEIFRRLKRKKK